MTLHTTRAPLAALALVTLAADAHAQGSAVVLGQVLALAGLLGGAVAGGVAGYREAGRLRLGPSFLIYLGLLCAVASTWAGSMDILPLTLTLGAAAGIVPYSAAFFGVRYLVTRWRGHPGPTQPPAPPLP